MLEIDPTELARLLPYMSAEDKKELDALLTDRDQQALARAVEEIGATAHESSPPALSDSTDLVGVFRWTAELSRPQWSDDQLDVLAEMVAEQALAEAEGRWVGQAGVATLH